MIVETIEFKFADEDQQKRFHERLDGEDGFHDQVWGLSILARSQIEVGDSEGAMKTLRHIADVAAERFPKGAE